jgi:hypothetical protein
MQPPPAGLWGMPPDMLQTLSGYGPNIQLNRADARQIMHKLGYGSDNRLKIKVSVRDLVVAAPSACLIQPAGIKHAASSSDISTMPSKPTVRCRFEKVCTVPMPPHVAEIIGRSPVRRRGPRPFPSGSCSAASR